MSEEDELSLEDSGDEEEEEEDDDEEEDDEEDEDDDEDEDDEDDEDDDEDDDEEEEEDDEDDEEDDEDEVSEGGTIHRKNKNKKDVPIKIDRGPIGNIIDEIDDLGWDLAAKFPSYNDTENLKRTMMKYQSMGNLKKPVNNVQYKREEPYGKNTDRNFYRDLDERDQYDKIPVKTNWQDATRRYADNYIKNPNDMKNYDENRNFSGEHRSRGYHDTRNRDGLQDNYDRDNERYDDYSREKGQKYNTGHNKEYGDNRSRKNSVKSFDRNVRKPDENLNRKKQNFADIRQREYRSPAERKEPVDNYYQNMYNKTLNTNNRTAKALYKNTSQKNVIAEEDFKNNKTGGNAFFNSTKALASNNQNNTSWSRKTNKNQINNALRVLGKTNNMPNSQNNGFYPY